MRWLIRKLFGLIVITERQKRLLADGRKAIKKQKFMLSEIDEILIHKDFDLTEGSINDHPPPNAKKINNKEYAKASNFYSILYKQKLEELKSYLI